MSIITSGATKVKMILTVFLLFVSVVAHASIGRDLTPNTFDQNVLTGDGIKMVEFWAVWCPYCKQLNEDIIPKLDLSRFEQYNVDLDEGDNVELFKEYRVRGVPTILFFDNGQVIYRIEGLRTVEEMESELKQIE